MYRFAMIGRELAMTKDDICTHVFKKVDTMPWFQYKHMVEWIKLYTQPSEEYDVIWSKAVNAWNSLTVETQAFLVTLG